METKIRSLGIDGLGDLSLGTHVCLFYETEQDLIETLALYFNNFAKDEFCLWITPESFEKARDALRQAIPSADQHLKTGHIEIFSSQQWYFTDGTFDAARAIEGFDTKLAQVLEKGNARMRVLADEAWLSQENWKAFSEYEGQLVEQFANKSMSIVCAYPTASHNAADILDVARTHRFVATKRNGNWEIFEVPELKRINSEPERLNQNKVQEQTADFRRMNPALQAEISNLQKNKEILQSIFDNVPAMITMVDKDGRFILTNREFENRLGWRLDELTEQNPDMLAELYPNPQAHQAVLDFVERAGGRWEDFRTGAKDGRVIDTSWAMVRLSDGSIIGVGKDITERKQMENALRESEAKLKEAQQLAHIGYWERDLIADRITGSEETRRIFGLQSFDGGFSHAQLQGMIHPDDRQIQEQALSKALQGIQLYDMEFRIIRPDGDLRFVHARDEIEYDESGRPIRIFGAVQDITERKRLEENLRKAELQYRTLVEFAPPIIYVAGLDQHIGVTYISPRIYTLGFTQEEWLADPELWFRQIHLEDQQRVLDEIKEGKKTGGVIKLEYRIRARDGSIHWFLDEAMDVMDENGNFAFRQGIMLDISERKGVEEALAASETELRALFASMNDVVLVIDRDGIYRKIAPTNPRLLYKPSEELLGKSLQDVFPPEQAETFINTVRQVVEKQQTAHIEYQLVIDEKVIWFDASISPKAADSTLWVARDITERKQAEEEIRQHTARMQMLAELSRALAECGLDYQRVLDTIVQRTAEIIGDACIIILYSDDKQQAFPVAYHHRDPKAYVMMRNSFFPIWQGSTDNPYYQTLLSGNSMYLPVVALEEFRVSLDPKLRNLVDEFGVSSFIGVPLSVHGDVIGALSIIRDSGGASYTHDDQVLLQDLADRAALTIQSAQLFEQVQGARQRLQTLSRQLLVAQEEERRAVARELHDEIGQTLTGLVMHLGMAKSLLPKSPGPARNILEQSEALIQETLERTRAVIAGLRPQVLDDLGLVPALRRLGEEFQENTGVTVEIETDHLTQRLPAPIETALFRIVQEALTNVRKHAQARRVSIALSREGEQVVLSVQDDGVGFEQQAARSAMNNAMILEGGWTIPYGHFGLLGIQERVMQLGGRLQITSAPGQGATLRVELPLSETKEVADENI
jgi:PAS domain S-box-containing protein